MTGLPASVDSLFWAERDWPISLIEFNGLPGHEVLDPAPALDLDQVGLFGVRADLRPTSVDFQVQTVTAVPEGKRQPSKLFRPQGRKYDAVGAEFQTSEAPLQQVDATDIAAKWMPSKVVPPCRSAMSDIKTCWKYFMARSRSPRARTQGCTTALN